MINDFGALQNLVDQANKGIQANYNLTLTLSAFVLVNIILAGLDIFFQFRLKTKEKGITKHNLRESKRIDAQEHLYNLLEELSYYDGNDPTYSAKVSLIMQFLTKKRIFLNGDIIKLTQEYTDYFLTVLVDFRNKDYDIEMMILDRYCKIFNDD